LYDFIAVVPSANGQLILRQAEGWAVKNLEKKSVKGNRLRRGIN